MHDIADKNIERLVTAAYRPEALDPGFVKETEDKLRVCARELAQARQQTDPLSAPAPAPALRRLRARLGWAMTAAAVLACVYLLHRAASPRATTIPEPERRFSVGDTRTTTLEKTTRARLTPKPRSAPPAAKPIPNGETVATNAGERRRVVLEDGSVVFLNQRTQIRAGERRIELQKGEVYVEVAPREPGSGATFEVVTPNRTVAALGTHFAVQADEKKSGVLVTQGRVKVSDLDKTLISGQQLITGSDRIATAPRATHELDWTKELMAAAETPLVPGPSHCGGALLAIDPFGQEVKLTLRKHHIDVHIEDGFARTTIDQTYFNNETWRLEGTFYFPLPPDASLSRLAMYVEDGADSKLNEGGMAERKHAANVYEEIRNQRRDPALLEWVDGSTFKMRVFPLEGRKEKRIILSYTQRLPSLYGSYRYRFPAGHTMDLVRDWSFAARVQHGAEMRVSSPSHPDMAIAPAGGDMTLSASAHAIKADKDVILDIFDGSDPGAAVRFNTAIHENAEYLMLRYRPELKTEMRLARRDWVILFESGANRDPLLARTQIEVLRHLLDNAEHDDTFTLATANTRVHFFDKAPRPATKKNVDEAIAWLETAHLIGALDLNQALEAVTPVCKTARNAYLVHVGAGVPALGERRDDVLAKRIPAGARYVGIGVGKKWNRAFMKQAADRSNGYFTQINPDEPIRWKAFDLLATLNTPRLMDVKVSDRFGKRAFLTEALTLAEGEELCAITRADAKLGEKLPPSVLITGVLDGKPFREELKIKDAKPGADYLPRTWAKLEIDRLLAEGSEKNQEAITKLSMAMYVMSPFTSLLVLETEEDYKKFNVDRGRKDHWAMYDCPPRMPTVYEPDPLRQAWLLPKATDGTKSPEEVLQSVLVRPAPRFITLPGRDRGGLPACINGFVLWSGVYDVSFEDDFGIDFGFQAATEFRLGDLRREPAFDFREADLGKARLATWDLRFSRFAEEAAPVGRRLSDRLVRGGELGRPPRFLASLKKKLKDGKSAALNLFDDSGSMLWGERAGTGEDLLLSNEWFHLPRLAHVIRPKLLFKDMDELALDLAPRGRLEGRMAGRRLKGLRKLDDVANLMDGVSTYLALSRLDNKEERREPELEKALRIYPVGDLVVGSDWENINLLEALAETALRRSPGQHLIFSGPRFQRDYRLFGDLTLYAPGLNTTWADLQTAVEREARNDKPVPVGTIDDGARRLIDAARAAGWEKITIPAHDRMPAFDLLANGAGRCRYSRSLSSGLKEEVVCDGDHLWHLYAEIGLAARRPNSRHHAGELTGLVPWLLPLVEDLARGADVKLIGDNIVAIVPRLPAAKEGKDKAAKTYQLHLVFERDRFIERRLIEMPSTRTVLRTTFAADGTCRLLDEKDKTLTEVKLGRSPAAAPELTPALDDLLVVRFPVRSTDYLHQETRFHSTEFGKLSKALAEDVFVAMCWEGNGNNLRLFAERFHSKGDRRLGFYTLLNCQRTVFSMDTAHTYGSVTVSFNPAKEHPGAPLGRYLEYNQRFLGGHTTALASLDDYEPGFLRNLVACRNVVTTWEQNLVGSDDTLEFNIHCYHTLEVLKQAPDLLWAWAIVDAVQRNGRSVPELHLGLAQAQKDLGEKVGLIYSSRYQHASNLYAAKKIAEARKLFLALYEDAFKEGVIPPIDGTFRVALNADSPEGAEPFARFLREHHAKLLADKRPLSALLLTWQTYQMGETGLANEFFLATLNAVPDTERNLFRLAALEVLWHTGQYAYADTVMQPILDDPVLGKQAFVWRVAAHIANGRGLLAKSVMATEKALDLEYDNLPEIINLRAVRERYGALLGQYQQLANAFTVTETEAPKELIAKVIKVADRWRSLDPDNMQPPETAAHILQALGARELAWDYCTTPIGMKPAESEPWLRLAGTLRAEANFELADRAYVAAYDAEPTNAQILWDRALNLQTMGRMAQAREVYQQIAEGSWQPRFRGLQEQAKGLR